MGVPEGLSPASYRGTSLRRVNWSKDADTVRRLFQDYRQWLANHRDTAAAADSRVRMGLAQIDTQIAELPRSYGPPRGEIILAFAKKAVVACGALRELKPKVAEIKRIYVRADHRGPGFGPRLTRALLRRARELGYERVRVDTLPSMYAAIQFYQELGFAPIPAYWDHPVSGALFFECKVGKRTSTSHRRKASGSKRSRK
ncbi:MAG: GNAT family N-acetyltransferase [Thermoplasmata archaeon]